MFYDKLKKLYQEYPTFSRGSVGSRVYNLEETSTSTVAKLCNVLAEKGVKQVSQVSSAERGTLVTTCCIINALSSAVPPVMVFPRKHPKKWMIADTPAATLDLASPLGWMIAELFLEDMQHFIKYAHALKENPALPIFDNHASHISIPVIDLAKESGVHLLTIHPHCSHKLQPLDVAVYGPFKAYYCAAVNEKLLHRPGEPLAIYDFGKLVKIAHTKAMSPTKIISGFRRTGIFPFNDDIFEEHEFFGSCVSDRPESEGPTQKIAYSVEAKRENEAGLTSSVTPLLHVSSNLIASDPTQSTPNSDRTVSPPHSSNA